MGTAKSPVPEGFHTVTPQLVFDNAAQAIDWYKKALGAEEKSRAVGPDGKIMHAELQIGNSRIMLNDAMGGGKSAKAFGGSPISLWVYVQDCDALFNRAVAAGAQGPAQQAQAENVLTGALRSLFAVVENYPDLKASTNVLELQEQLTTTENQISFSRQHYNATVLDYNTSIATFPNALIAGPFGFTKREFFDAEPEAAEVPVVQLR